MRKIHVLLFLLVFLIFIPLEISFLTGFIGGDVMALEIESSAFEEGDFIPAKYTCKGEDVSPPLNWDDIPEGTKSFALICDDPDAPVGTWVHWVIYNVPAETDSLEESISTDDTLSDGTLQGINDFRKTGYGGPCPPPGGPHRYFFKLYALDTKIDLKPRATKKDLLKAMEGHILEEAQIIGKFSASRR